MAKTTALSVSSLYWLNAALLLTHEIDSGYWKEWNLFGIPGGIQVFLVLNFILLMVVLYGFKQVLLNNPSAFAFSLLLCAGGVFAFMVHLLFILSGRTEFTEPISLIVLGALLVVSLMQVRATLQKRESV